MNKIGTWITGSRTPYTPLFSPPFATLDDLKERIGSDPDITTKDDVLIDFIYEASGYLAKVCRRTFVPFVHIRQIKWRSPYKLELPEDLIEITSLSDMNGVVDPTNYDFSATVGVTRVVTPVGAYTFPRGTITITGVWGYHLYPLKMWQKVTELPAAIDATSNQITVSDSSSIKILDLIQIDGEVMLVTDNDTGTNQLTVIRGALGTIAAAHNVTPSDVNRYAQSELVAHATLEYAGYLYKRRGQFDSAYVVDVGNEVQIDRGLPASVIKFIEQYAR